jgi:DNA polymerase-3 subunit delta'
MLYPWLMSSYADVIARIHSQQLHHGLLFIADQGTGETELLSQLAEALLCEKVKAHAQTACHKCKSCMLFAAQSHPDLKRVVSDKPSIGVDLIRNAGEFVTTTSQLLGNKVVIINDIHLMTEAASNSLLKTLEEPTNNTYILLSTHQPANLLATLKSRCEKIRLKLPAHQVALDWITTQVDTPVSIEGLKAYAGSPLDYLAALKDSTQSYAQFSEDIQALKDKNITGLALASKWQSEPALVLRWTYQWCTQQYKEAMMQQISMSEMTKRQSMLDSCQQANRKINQAGVNKSLLLQNVFNTIQQRAF